MKERRGARWHLRIGLASLLLLGASPAVASDDVRADIEAANDKLEAAVSRGDGAAMAALYTADAQVLPPQSDVVTGTEAIGAFWQGVLDSGVEGVSLVTLEVESHGDTAHEVGRIEIRGADGAVLDRAKYIVIWKREGDVWKLHRDIWASSVPPAAP